jgi:putative hydrolase of the HAD superfamily
MVRHLFFDFFGTLVRYDREIRAARISQAAGFVRGLGCTASEAELAYELAAVWRELERDARQTLREPHWHTAAARLLEHFGLPCERSAVTGFTDAYHADWCEGVEPIPGIREMLQRLGLPAAIVTNTYYPPLVPGQLRRFGLADSFQFITTSVEHGLRKPHPTIYQRALATAGRDPADVLFVGDDAECDYHGPRVEGMRAVVVSPVPVVGVAEEDRIGHILELEPWLATTKTC